MFNPGLRNTSVLVQDRNQLISELQQDLILKYFGKSRGTTDVTALLQARRVRLLGDDGKVFSLPLFGPHAAVINPVVYFRDRNGELLRVSSDEVGKWVPVDNGLSLLGAP